MLKSLLAKFKNGKTAKNSLIALFQKMMGIGLLFGITMFLTNNFSADLVGKYSFSRSVLLILGGISILGAEQSIIYYSGYLKSKNAFNNIKDVYLKMLRLIFISTFFLFLLVFSINPSFINSFFEVDNPFLLIQKVVIYLFFHSVMMLNIEVLRAMDRIIWSEFHRNIMRYLLFLIAAYLLLMNGMNEWLVDAYLSCFVVLATITSIQVYFEFKKLGNFSNEVKITTKEIFKTSYPMALNAMTFFLLQSTDVIMLGKFTNFDTVAYYDTAVKVASLTQLGVMSVNLVVAPKLSEEFNRNNYSELKKVFQSGIKLMLFLSFPTILFLFLFANFTLSLFGQEYTAAKDALFILMIAQFLTTFMGISGTYMNMTGKQNVLHKILLFAFILNVILNFIFTPKLGMNGAALATGISIVSWNLIAAFYIYRKDKISFIN